MVIEKLRRKENFTALETDIAELTLRIGDQIGGMSIREFAEMCYTSTAAVQRLCKKLGCSGYKDFRIRYIKELSAMNENSVPVDVSRPFHFGAQAPVIARNLSIVYRSAVEDCMNVLDYGKLNQAVDMIRKADKIIFFAHGDSGITCRASLNRLLKLRKYCVLANENNDEYAAALAADQSCLGIFVSYRGGSESLNRCCALMKEKKIPFIVLSRNVKTMLTETAPLHIIIPDAEERSDNIATFYSQECFSFILGLLYSMLYARNYAENYSKKKEADTLISKMD